jgi:hypothetical protein
VFDLQIAHLKAIQDADLANIEPAFFSDAAHQLSVNSDHQSCIQVLNLPAAGGAWRDNIDIAVHGNAGVALSGATTVNMHRGTEVNHDGWTGMLSRIFDHSRRIGGDTGYEHPRLEIAWASRILGGCSCCHSRKDSMIKVPAWAP